MLLEPPEWQGLPGLPEQWDPPALRAIRELQEPQELLDLRGQRAHRVMLDQLDRRVFKVSMAFKAM